MPNKSHPGPKLPGIVVVQMGRRNPVRAFRLGLLVICLNIVAFFIIMGQAWGAALSAGHSGIESIFNPVNLLVFFAEIAGIYMVIYMVRGVRFYFQNRKVFAIGYIVFTLLIAFPVTCIDTGGIIYYFLPKAPQPDYIQAVDVSGHEYVPSQP